ncbi:MAG: hypothetical protein NT126_07540 [Bacteroidetes bacterium]|nr:hypothetical protein [Bacteroidota bacterium]
MKKIFLTARFIFFVLQPMFSQVPDLTMHHRSVNGTGHEAVTAFHQLREEENFQTGSFSDISADKSEINIADVLTCNTRMANADSDGNAKLNIRFVNAQKILVSLRDKGGAGFTEHPGCRYSPSSCSFS